jgi:uncharacterized protein (DUF362 family)
MSKVSFIQSNNRKYNISRSLSLIKSEVIAGLKNAKRIVVQPSCYTDDFQLAATHVDALDSLLEFIFPYSKNQITVAEGTTIGDTMTAFKNYSYFSIQEKYGFAVVDLNTDDTKNIEVFDRRGNPLDICVSETILDSDYLISICPPKTHDSVVFSGAIESVVEGSLNRPVDTSSGGIMSRFSSHKNSKSNILQGSKYTNLNVKTLALKKMPDLAIIDGFSAMQGDGPGHGGEMVPAHWAISSSDSLSADILACNLIGIDIKDVGYLSKLTEEFGFSDPFVIGDDWRGHILKFKMHSEFDKIKRWQ